MTSTSFSFDIPLPYEQWLATRQALTLLQRGPLRLPDNVNADAAELNYEEVFADATLADGEHVSVAREDNPLCAEIGEALIRILWDQDVRTDLQKQVESLDCKLCAPHEPSGYCIVRISEREDWEHADLSAPRAAIALIQACQQAFDAPALGFTFYGSHGPNGDRDATAVVVPPGKKPAVFSLESWLARQLRRAEAGAEVETFAAALPSVPSNFEKDCLQAMVSIQEEELFDLTDEDNRTQLVDKAVERVLVGTQAYDTLVTTAFNWGLEAARAVATAAPDAGADPSP